jgi:hypothetical protein
VEQADNTVEWFHLVGYPTAFVVAPLALLSFAVAGRHR